MRWLTRLAVLALFVVAVSAPWWLETVREPRRERPPTVAAERLPDHYFTGFRMRRYLGDGSPRQELAGSRLDHFPATATAIVARPRLDYRPARAPRWRIRGERGTLAEATDVIEIEGDVRLHRPAVPGARPLTLLTPYLRYDLDAEIATTERPVRVLSPGSRVDATGMTAWLAREYVELHADVRARHDPALAGGDDGDG